MNNKEFLYFMNSGKEVIAGSEIHQHMTRLSQEAIQITTEINNAYHTPEQLCELFSKLIGKPVDETFTLFPPFTTDCGKNIHLGKHIFESASDSV